MILIVNEGVADVSFRRRVFRSNKRDFSPLNFLILEFSIFTSISLEKKIQSYE